MPNNNRDAKEADRRIGVLMKLYEINYDYQNQKEQRVWLLFSIYITILLAAIGWITANPSIFRSFLGIVLFGSVLLLFSIFSIVYMTHQNWLKAWSVERDYRMLRLIRRLPAKQKPTYHAIVSAAYPGKEGTIENSKRRIFLKNGWSGFLMISIVLAITIILLILLVLYLAKATNSVVFRLWR